MSHRCAYCDSITPLLAARCAECGAANLSRRAVFGTIAALAILGPAIVIAIYAATRWDAPLIPADGTPADQAQPSPAPGVTTTDYRWLSDMMKACDDAAAKEQNALHFLIVPLTFDPKDIEDLRKISLNTIGNALVLGGKDTLTGLQSGRLRIATEEYVFSIRDEGTQAVRRWDAATGVKWLSLADGTSVAILRMQYKPRSKGRDDNWGNAVEHSKGHCYWLNAISE